nr:PREDICTED: uncharacterized protein LOC104229528 [Nicotiana sylvestris]
MTHQVSAIVHLMAPRLEDPDAFTVLCTIGSANFAKALCDMGPSIILIPYSVFKTLCIGQLRATSMRLQMADRTTKRPLGIVDDVLVRVNKAAHNTEVCSLVDLVTTVIVDDTSAMISVEDPLEEVDATLAVLQKRKKAIGWTLADMRGISPAFCMHKIIIEEDAKPSVEY